MFDGIVCLMAVWSRLEVGFVFVAARGWTGRGVRTPSPFAIGNGYSFASSTAVISISSCAFSASFV